VLLAGGILILGRLKAGLLLLRAGLLLLRAGLILLRFLIKSRFTATATFLSLREESIATVISVGEVIATLVYREGGREGGVKLATVRYIGR